MKFIKKVAIITISLLCVNVPITAHATSISINLGGEFINLESNNIYIEDGSTMVPLRFIAESMGATVDYDEFTQKVLIEKDDRHIALEINSSKVLINNEEMELSVTPVIKDNMTMVPLRFVSETLGIYINYNAINKIIYLSTLQYNVPDDIVAGYMLAIDLVYEKDIALNDDMTYIAIDTTQMSYLSEASKQNLLKEMKRYGIVVEATYEQLQEQGLIKAGRFTNGILITINDLYSEGGQLILDIEKWRSNLGALGCVKMILEKDNDNWSVIDKGMWYQS